MASEDDKRKSQKLVDETDRLYNKAKTSQEKGSMGKRYSAKNGQGN